MYDRREGERTLTFDFGEGLVADNLLIVDRETTSIWSQLHGEAIHGPLRGKPMRVVPALQTTWAHWRSLHPDTRVLTVPGTMGHAFSYRQDRGPLGLGLVVGHESLFAPLDTLGRCARPEPERPSPSLSVELGGRAVRLFVERSANTAWAEDAEGRMLPGVLAYRPGWLSFHPDTKVLTESGELEPRPAAEHDGE